MRTRSTPARPAARTTVGAYSIPATCRRASASLSARWRSSSLAASPWRISTLSPSSLEVLRLSTRTRQRVSWPRASSSLSNAPPSKPVAPVRSILIRPGDVLALECVLLYGPQPVFSPPWSSWEPPLASNSLTLRARLRSFLSTYSTCACWPFFISSSFASLPPSVMLVLFASLKATGLLPCSSMVGRTLNPSVLGLTNLTVPNNIFFFVPLLPRLFDALLPCSALDPPSCCDPLPDRSPPPQPVRSPAIKTIVARKSTVDSPLWCIESPCPAVCFAGPNYQKGRKAVNRTVWPRHAPSQDRTRSLWGW